MRCENDDLKREREFLTDALKHVCQFVHPHHFDGVPGLRQWLKQFDPMEVRFEER